jgi:hypothetical protein
MKMSTYLHFLCSEHYQKVSGESSLHIEKRHEAEFERWFQNRICGSNAANVSKQLYDLACGPDYLVRSYKGCIVNGVRFHTTECEQTRTTQNSGIVVRGEHGTSNIEFYGVLRNILELRYPGPNHVYLFECDWWNTGIRTGMQTDQYFTTVNTSRTWYESDPFILASQASQVFYLNDIKLGGSWKVVQKMTHRNIYDIPTILERDNEEEDQGVSGEVHQERECVGGNAITVEANNEDSNLLCRDDVEPIPIAVDEVYVELDENMFIDDNLYNEEHDTNSDDEEELSSNENTDSDHEEEFSSDTDTNSNDDMC